MRVDGRRPAELRPIKIVPNWLDYAEGSALIEMGDTRVLCAATVQEGVPDFLVGSGRGWVTGEYSLLPRSTHRRTEREAKLGRLHGRTQEINRLIGRALRAAVELGLLGERSVILDCDVLQADGGTRVAAINGGYVALRLALERLIEAEAVPGEALLSPVAAVSVGLVDGRALLDLTYEEDAQAEVDLNLVMNREGELVEVQATAEKGTFGREKLGELLELGWVGLVEVLAAEERAFQEGLTR